MKPIQIILILIWSAIFLTNLNAERDTYSIPKVGTTINGGIFLHRESVEMYWDDWVAYPMLDRKDLPSNGQVTLAINGEGKSVNFNGILSINCENGQNYWEAANADAPEEHIPVAVNNNAVSLFCKGNVKNSNKPSVQSTNTVNNFSSTPNTQNTPSQATSSGPLTCTTSALVNMVTKQYEDHAFDLLLSTRFGMKTTYADFQNIMNNAETPKGKNELQHVLNKTMEAYKNISVSIQLIGTINKDESSGMVECVGTLDFGNGKTAEAGYKGQYTDNGEIYMVYKPLF